MKVYTLIEKLKNFPKDAEIVIDKAFLTFPREKNLEKVTDLYFNSYNNTVSPIGEEK